MSDELILMRGVAQKARDFFNSCFTILDNYIEKSKPKKTVNKGKKKKPEKLSEEEVKQPTEKRKRKKPDPYAPKRPLTSYMFFCNYRRELLKEENPSLLPPEQVQIIANEWRKLSEEDRKIWNEKAKRDKLRYDLEVSKFNREKSTIPDTPVKSAVPKKKEGKKNGEDKFGKEKRDLVKQILKAHPSSEVKEKKKKKEEIISIEESESGSGSGDDVISDNIIDRIKKSKHKDGESSGSESSSAPVEKKKKKASAY